SYLTAALAALALAAAALLGIGTDLATLATRSALATLMVAAAALAATTAATAAATATLPRAALATRNLTTVPAMMMVMAVVLQSVNQSCKLLAVDSLVCPALDEVADALPESAASTRLTSTRLTATRIGSSSIGAPVDAAFATELAAYLTAAT